MVSFQQCTNHDFTTLIPLNAIEIKAIASKLKTQPAVLSRTFKSDFGETPAFYRKGLRVTVYREVTLIVFGYFPTLLAGKPIGGQDFQESGMTLFILAPVSDSDAPSGVLNRFVIRGGKEKIRIHSYLGSLRQF